VPPAALHQLLCCAILARHALQLVTSPACTQTHAAFGPAAAVTGPDSWGACSKIGLVVLFVHLGRFATAMNLLGIRAYTM
jgi:hypothetical protein